MDTHADVHVAAALDELGALVGTASFATTPAGYRQLADWLAAFGPISRVGIEGTGSYGAGAISAAFLTICRPASIHPASATPKGIRTPSMSSRRAASFREPTTPSSTTSAAPGWALRRLRPQRRLRQRLPRCGQSRAWTAPRCCHGSSLFRDHEPVHTGWERLRAEGPPWGDANTPPAGAHSWTTFSLPPLAEASERRHRPRRGSLWARLGLSGPNGGFTMGASRRHPAPLT
jgi:hypothetical protein